MVGVTYSDCLRVAIFFQTCFWFRACQRLLGKQSRVKWATDLKREATYDVPGRRGWRCLCLMFWFQAPPSLSVISGSCTKNSKYKTPLGNKLSLFNKFNTTNHPRKITFGWYSLHAKRSPLIFGPFQSPKCQLPHFSERKYFRWTYPLFEKKPPNPGSFEEKSSESFVRTSVHCKEKQKSSIHFDGRIAP